MRGIKYVSQEPTTGYGRAAREYMRQLVQRGIPLTWTPMVPGRGWGAWLEPFAGEAYPDPVFGHLVNRPIDYDVVIVHHMPESVPRWQREEPGKTLLVMTVWELDRLQPHWPGILNHTHGVMVPCAWNREVFRANGVTVPIAVIPHVAPETTPTMAPPLPGVRDDDFVFYSIASWRERNAPHLTLEAYLRAFRAEDPVALVLKTSRTNERRYFRGFWNYRVRRHFDTTARQIAQVRRKTRSTARVAVLLDDLTEGEIAALHARGDAYVSLTHGEGWGLGAYEAAWAGNPVIITGYGGQCDFLPPDLAYLLGYRLVPFHDPFLALEEPVVGIGASWAEPDMDMAVRVMREVAAHPDAARARGAQLKAHVSARFSAASITDELVRFVEQIGPA